VEVLQGSGGAFALGEHRTPQHRLAVELRIAGSPLAVQPGGLLEQHTRLSGSCMRRPACSRVYVAVSRSAHMGEEQGRWDTLQRLTMCMEVGSKMGMAML
jgi:hypothetical protein